MQEQRLYVRNRQAQWLISTAGLGFRFRLGFQTLWLYYAEHNNIMQNMFPLTWIQFRIPFQAFR